MKKVRFVSIMLLYFFLFNAPLNTLQGQQAGCVFKAPVFEMDFGNEKIEEAINQSALANYRKTYSKCPNDGFFSIVSNTSDCYGGHWITLNQDHTINDTGGKMMLVNSSYPPGTFFVTPVNGLAANTRYELAVWMVNVCLSCNNDIPLSPQFNFIIENASGKPLVNFATGELKPTGSPTWIRHSGLFTTPANVGPLVLRMVNKVNGGCGNDFAMDDITIRECVVPIAAAKAVPPPKPAIKKPIPVTKSVVKKIPPAAKPIKKEIPEITKIPVKDIPVIPRQMIKERQVIALPKLIQTRTNPIIKQIETPPADIVIDLYDNGEIDGDTVSVYHNNILIASRAGLSAIPVTFRIRVDAMHPHHELVMVANNLGSIPPNTSLMIVTARDKRYEIFISSSEQKNAKVVIGLKE